MSSIAMSSMTAAPSAGADATVVYPGMEIRQDSTVCTLGFVDVVTRIAYSAGHCRGSGPVTDRNGRFIGVVTTSRDNTPDGTVVRTDQVISDYQTISLAAGVTANNVLPGGRQLVTDPAAALAPGQPVCHFGVITGESCWTIEGVNNGWFTMENGVVSQKGDSGGPVYTVGDSGQAVLIGLFNSTWGNLPAAVSWQATSAQLAADIASASVINAAAKN
ncbi:MAG: S1 family peptidase [Mycobacterium sp.]|nr:S1 family peptidase [Mycobacterium sp.]